MTTCEHRIMDGEAISLNDAWDAIESLDQESLNLLDELGRGEIAYALAEAWLDYLERRKRSIRRYVRHLVR